MYDYLIVGAGLYGAVFASEMTKAGKRCLVIEKRSHIGGNIYTENVDGINVHKYGAHIFHTNKKELWDYINKFSEFNNFINSPVANYKGELYNLPFNMNTFSKLWKVGTPVEVEKIIEKQRSKILGEPKNLEEQAIKLVGEEIYQKLIKGYTEKQWGRKCNELPPEIIKRLPIRLTYDNNYFSDRYQGIPIGGYTQIIEKMLENSELLLEVDFLKQKEFWSSKAKKVVYTGSIDAYFDYCFGKLEYRRVEFETETLNMPNYQGVAVMNYTDKDTPFTRIIEHKHFEFGTHSNTVISREYSKEWKLGDEPYYPIGNQENVDLYNRYKMVSKKEKNVIFGGRLGEYKYLDMDKVIEASLVRVKLELNN